MSNLKQEILSLKEKKARQFMEIEMLAEINDSVYTKFGKTVAEIMLKEKELLRQSQNQLNEN